MRKRGNWSGEAGLREAHGNKERGPWRALGANPVQERCRSQRAMPTARSPQRAQPFGDGEAT
eukprot:87949-Alexandrium_andersonii.AAC.1